MEVQGFQGFVEEIDYNELEILEVCFLASGFLKISCHCSAESHRSA